MKTVDDYEKIRKVYYVEGMSIRAISRQLGHSRKVIRKALDHAEPEGYQRKKPHTAPKIAPYQSRIEELLKESEQMPRKQRYTGHKIYQLLQMEGYRGSESNYTVTSVAATGAQTRPRICLEFDVDKSASGLGRSAGRDQWCAPNRAEVCDALELFEGAFRSGVSVSKTGSVL
jgi:transposase